MGAELEPWEYRKRLHERFSDDLHDAIDHNAAVDLWVQTDGPHREGDMPYVWLCVSNKTDPAYFGTLLGNFIWNWWELNADDVEFPEPQHFIDMAIEEYNPDSFLTDPTGAWVSDWIEEAYRTATEIVDSHYRKLMHAHYDSIYGNNGY